MFLQFSFTIYQILSLFTFFDFFFWVEEEQEKRKNFFSYPTLSLF